MSKDITSPIEEETDLAMLAMLREMTDRLFENQYTRQVQAGAQEGQWPEALWQSIMQAGLTSAAVPQSLGGAGASITETSLIMRACGRHALALPLVETLIGNWLLAQAGCQPDLGVLALGSVLSAKPVQLVREGARWILSDCIECVPWAMNAQHFVCVAHLAEGVQAVILAPMDAAKVDTACNIAGEPRCQIKFDQLDVSGGIFKLPAGVDHAAALFRLGALARCQQMVGAMEWIFEHSLVYASERVQFGKPIGSFQAIGHMAAVMATQVSAAQVAADAGMMAFGSEHADLSAGYAKARVGEAAGELAALSHQLHGAMGYSHEYPLHWRSRRLWAWRDEFGSELHWNTQAGNLLAERGGTALWSCMKLSFEL